jgi:putative transposase
MEDRSNCINLVDEAVRTGARQARACEMLGISTRTLERWRKHPEKHDMRKGPHCKPANSLSDAEKQTILETANSERFKDKPPAQIVPILLDEGCFIASESSFYRVLKENDMTKHRENTRVRKHSAPTEYNADGPNQVWSWDITYLKSTIKGLYYYLYMIVDIFSRMIVGWSIHPDESAEYGSALISETCLKHGVERNRLILHSDNGGPMKGATMLSTLQFLGVMASFSRPRVSDDNPYSESLFKTLKYRPEYPVKPFSSIEAAEAWVQLFVKWYNYEHRHSGINYVTPHSRHIGVDIAILEKRKATLEAAMEMNPERWIQGKVRNCESISTVILNPGRKLKEDTQRLKKVC